MASRMHQTTIRFGPDTWAALELEAAHLGVSAAQYVRDATLSRLARDRPGALAAAAHAGEASRTSARGTGGE